jgi:HSP20 family protein
MPTRTVPLTREFDRLAASFFGPGRASLSRQIPVDAVQRDDRLVLSFDLPGVPEDGIEINLERRVLTVKAERPQHINEGDHVFLAERPWGAMSRQVVLGDTLDIERVTANYDRGVLTITAPLATTAKSRKIEIDHAPVQATATEVTAESESSSEGPEG